MLCLVLIPWGMAPAPKEQRPDAALGQQKSGQSRCAWSREAAPASFITSATFGISWMESIPKWERR